MKKHYLFLLALLASAIGFAQCNYSLVLEDAFGDGWGNGSQIVVTIAGGTPNTYIVPDPPGDIITVNLTVNDGDSIELDYTADAITPGDNTYRLFDSEGILVFDADFAPGSAINTFTATCPTCPAPTNLVANTVAATSAEFAWDAGGTETEWEFEYGITGFTVGSGTTQTVTANPGTLTGLSASTTYDVYIRAVCSTTDSSSARGPVAITTTESCPTPSNFSSIDDTATSISFLWDAGGNPSSIVEIEYGPTPYTQGSGGSTSQQFTAPFADVTGLNSNTSYDFFVRIDCGGGDFSQWAGPYTSSTLQSCPDVSDVTISNVTMTAVDVAWNAGGTETEWSIEYGPVGFTAGSGTVVSNITTNPYTLTGLSSGVNYDICVTAVCGPTDLSTPVCANVLTPADYCNGDSLVDSGGMTGDYGINENFTYVVCPENAGDVVYVDFTSFQTESFTGGCFDGLTIYAGPDTSSPIISPPTGTGDIWCWENGVGTGDLTQVPLIGTLPSGCITFVFTSDGSVVESGFEATVVCGPPPACPVPNQFTVDSSTSDSITLSWVAGNSETEWDIEYGPVGFTPGSGTIATVTTNPNTISGLTSNTEYDFYIIANCSPTETSDQVGPITGRTSCNTFTVPFIETFNSTSTTQNCWTVVDENGDGDEWNMDYTFNPSEGDEVAMMYTDLNSGNNDDYLISPAITLTGNERMRFDYRVQSSGEPNDMDVVLSTGTNAVADFTNVVLPMATYSNTTYETETLDLSAFTGDVYIAFRIPASSTIDGWRMYVDNVRVEAIPSCAEPTALTNDVILANTAQISWTAGGTETSWEIEYGIEGFAPGTGSLVTSTTNPFTITGLVDNTCYDYYVRAVCPSGGTSVWSEKGSFCTPCVAIAAPYTQDFELFTATTSTFPGAANHFTRENCWTAVNNGAGWVVAPSTLAASGGTGPEPSVNTGNYIYLEASSGVTGDVSELYSPVLDLTALTAPALTFDYHMFGADMGNLYIDVNDGTGFVNDVFTLTGQQQGAESDPYTTVTVDMTNYISATVQIRFRGERGADYTSDMAIDNIEVDDFVGCIAPFNLDVPAVTFTTADLSWTPGSTETVWEYVVQLDGTGVPTGAGTSVTTTSLTESGLTADTDYEFYVRADCGSGNFSTWTGPFDFYTGYCSSEPSSNDGAGIGQVDLEGINFPSGGDINYEDFTGTTVTTDNSVSLDIEFQTGPTYHTNVWIDFNNDLVYDNTTELFFQGESTAANPTVLDASFIIPGGIPAGIYNMRIGTADFGQSTPNPCYNGSWGVTIDMVIDFVPSSCIDVSNITLDSITSDSATVSWTENNTPAATAWEVVAVVAGSAAPTPGTSNATTNPYTITALAPSTDYDVYVRVDCSTEFSGPLTITTACAPIVAPYGSTATPGNDFATFPGTCWEEGDNTDVATGPNGTNGAWTNDTFGNNGTNQAARINIYGTGPINDWLVTPEIDLGTSAFEAIFDIAHTNFASQAQGTFGSDDQVQFVISDDNGVTWTALQTWDASTTVSPTGETVVVDLSAYSGVVRMAFWGTNGTTSGQDTDFFVDNFIVDAAGSVKAPETLGFNFYPNPVLDVLTIDGLSTINQVNVFNLLGQEVYHTQPAASTAQVDLSTLAPGVYLVRVATEDQVSTIRVIKE